MTLLAQQELLEAPPPRRMIVPAGAEAWWGIDPSTSRVAVASVSRAADGSLDRWVELHPFPAESGPERLALIFEETFALVRSLAATRPAPGMILVEQPSGRVDNPELVYAVGVIAAAAFAGARKACGRRVAVEMVPSSSWKKAATGYGAHYKPTKKKLGRTPVFEDYAVARWAVENGYDGRSWDEADAWGIAEAARRTVELVPR